MKGGAFWSMQYGGKKSKAFVNFYVVSLSGNPIMYSRGLSTDPTSWIRTAMLWIHAIKTAGRDTEDLNDEVK